MVLARDRVYSCGATSKQIQSVELFERLVNEKQEPCGRRGAPQAGRPPIHTRTRLAACVRLLVKLVCERSTSGPLIEFEV